MPLKFKVWNHEDCRSEAVVIEERYPEAAAEAALRRNVERYNPESMPRVQMLVEWPDGTIVQVDVWMAMSIEYSSELDLAKFKDLEARIWAEDEDFYWQPIPQRPELPKVGPFESWQKAYLNARSCAESDTPNT